MKLLRTAWASLVKLFSLLFASAWIGAVIPLLSVAVGFTLSSSKEQIADGLLVVAAPGAPNFNPEATLFWLLIALLLLLGVANAWAKNRDSARSAQKVTDRLVTLHDQSRQLSTAVNRLHSLPPLGVLEDFRQAYDLCERLFHKAGALDLAPPAARAEFEVLVRNFLLVLSRVIRTFDGEHLRSSTIRYGLNVMLYMKRDEYIGLPLAGALAARLRFAEQGLTIDNAVGMLDMLPVLSVAADGVAPDEHLQSFAIPIGVTPAFAAAAHDEQPAIPGAALACVNMIHVAYSSIGELRQRLEERKAADSVKAEMREYFDEPALRRTVQSFVCVPLVANNTEMVGILNVHRDRANAGLHERLPLLVPLLTPMRHQLARLLLRYKVLYLR